MAVGETLILLPVPTNVPPQLPEYQFATAPVPAVPPVKVNVVELPLQTVVVPFIPVGATESVWTVTVILAHVVVLQVPL